MLAPQMRPETSNRSSTNFPKREELSLRLVLALPNASSSGFDSSTWSQPMLCRLTGPKLHMRNTYIKR